MNPTAIRLYAVLPVQRCVPDTTITAWYLCMCPAAQFGVQSLAYATPVAAANDSPQPVQRSLRTPKFASAHASTTSVGRTCGLPRQSGSACG